MLKVDYGDGYPSNWVRLCDTCGVAASAIYCHTDSAYLCNACDRRIHAVGSPCWPHHRVRVCRACENAPAAFICNADAASLCINCDYEIHSANPIASRHDRVPVLPLSHVAEETLNTDELRYSILEIGNDAVDCNMSREIDEREADSWLLLDSDAKDSQVEDGATIGEAPEENLGGVECDSSTKLHNQDEYDQQQTYSFSEDVNDEADSVVPIQAVDIQAQQQQQQMQLQQNIYFNMQHEASRADLTLQLPMPFVDPDVMPRSALSDITGCRFPKGLEMFPNTSSVSMQFHLGQMNRKAGVLKYREKRKSRKFEKRIRYAYRKAYAEKRPRVKGRFARRTDLTSEEPVALN